MVSFIGDHPLARNTDGTLRTRIATAFPRRGVIVTLPGIHVSQRCAMIDAINQQRGADGKAPLDDEEQMDEMAQAVDLIIDDNSVLIRPDPDEMSLAFEADEMLQELIPKRNIRFLFVLNAKVRLAIQRRGEAWRIHPLPKSVEQMRKMIADSRIAISGRPIYYYNITSGTRWLTFQQFSSLARLDDDELRRHLIEIADHCDLRNAHGRLELDFFSTGTSFCAANLQGVKSELERGEPVRAVFERLRVQFESAVAPAFRVDDLEDMTWRNRMYCALVDPREELISEEQLLGLSSEFFMQVEWLPGARLEEGELIFDSVFDESRGASQAQPNTPWEATARGLICNLIQEYGDMEYLNVGRLVGSIGLRGAFQGRRDVFIVQVKQRDSRHEVLQIIRMQKWDVRERLDQGADLLRAILESEEYTEYILDRRLGCKQLGMNLPPRITTRKLAERYSGFQRNLDGITIRSSYFQRDYVRGTASCRIAPLKLANDQYAERLAHVLGRAAAPNLIVGRSDVSGRLIFDDGDEIVVEDSNGLPCDIVVADHTGTFGNFQGDLRELAPNYANVVNRRAAFLTSAPKFSAVYIESFIERFEQIQAEYTRRKRAFDALFKHRHRDPGGNLAYRWECVLKRLAGVDARQLAAIIDHGVVMPDQSAHPQTAAQQQPQPVRA